VTGQSVKRITETWWSEGEKLQVL